MLEALPGRPISGERLVRPDGTVGLDHYGEVYVRGLTIEQAKEKIVLHLRKYLNDEVLGLVETAEIGTVDEESQEQHKPKPIPTNSKPNTSDSEPQKGSEGKPEPKADDSDVPRRVTKPAVQQIRVRRYGEAPEPDEPIEDGDTAKVSVVVSVYRVEPKDTTSVFVDITAYNSKVFFVEGDLGAPGRLPFTGNENVHDAINYAGGLAPTADPSNITLVRPGAGDKPAKIIQDRLEGDHREGRQDRQPPDLPRRPHLCRPSPPPCKRRSRSIARRRL